MHYYVYYLIREKITRNVKSVCMYISTICCVRFEKKYLTDNSIWLDRNDVYFLTCLYLLEDIAPFSN